MLTLLLAIVTTASAWAQGLSASGTVADPQIPILNPSDEFVASLGFISEIPTCDNGEVTNWYSGQNYNNLVDGNINNNYGLSSANPWVEFHYASPITPKGYALWTAQDTEKYPARNPKSWTIKAKNSGDADWTTLVTVDNSSGVKLPVTNVTRTVFALDNSTAYQYFRFEAVKDDTYGFQLAELQFCTLQPIIADLVIRSAADWNTFAQNVNNGTDDYQGKVVKLAADISVTTMVGTNEMPFAGTFDGDGHTMNLAINTTGTGGGHPNIAAAPFRYVNGATFKNIKLTGTVTRTDYPSDADVSLGGLIGILSQYRSATIIGCRSSVSINYDFTWDSGNFTTGHMGGFIGRSDGNAIITDCLFDGTLAGRPLHQGGFVGYLCWGGVTFNNCLMSGTSSANSTYQGNFYGRDNNGGAGSLNNCYYTNIIGSQGSYTTATGETLRAQLGYGWIVNGSGAVVPCMALQLPADANNITTIAAANGTRYDKVILTGRTLYRDGSWNTLCLPFNLSSFSGTPLEGATVKTLSSSAYSNGVLTLSFTSVSSIEAGKPYIVKWSSGSNIENPMFTNVTISSATANVVTTYANFLGSYAPFNSHSYLYDAHNTAGNGMNGALSISDPAPVSGQNVYWYTNSGRTQSVNTIPFNADGNVTLYGLWSGTFTIHYDLDGGTMEGNPTTYTIQSNITLVAPTREGYTFIGWTGSNGDTPQISVTIPAGSTGDLYYTAHWVPRVEYVEYNTSTKQYETKLVTTNFTTVTSSTTSLGNGWYVVTGNVTVNDPIGIGNDITARLVLCDGATLTAKNRINMERTSTLIIYGQSNGTGKLDAKSTKYSYNAIGTPQDQRGGTVIIHSGTVVATAVGNASAAIGGFGNYGHGGTVRIYGGNVTAKSTGEWGSGIGGAGWYGEGGTVEILGGTVVAEGGEHGKAIGGTTGGASASDGELSLGNVRVYASANASTPVNQGDRQSTCRSQYARIEKCTQHVGSGSRCQYCNASIYHVTYNSNKATSGTVPTDAIAYKSGQTATVLGNTGNLERIGYTFMGWNTEADGSGITYTAGATFTISDNITLYAKWTPILVLANNLNNSSAISAAAASGKYHNVTLADRTLYRDGTWNTIVLPFNLATLNGTPLEGFTVKTLQSSTFVNGELTLNFANANSIEAGKPYIVKWDQTPISNLVNPVFEDVLISDATANVSTTYADFIGSYTPINDAGLLLDAHNPNGDAMHAAIRAKLKGYSVSCYTKPDTNYPATSIPFSADGNVTLWTICIRIDYPITYNLNGGTNHPSNPATYNIDSETITLQAPSKTNYTFGGWFYNADCTGDAVNTIAHGSYGNVILYAKWLVEDLELMANGDNSSAISEAAASGKYYNVTLADRTIYRDGTWNTLVLPFNLATLTGTPLEGLTVKTLESSTYSDGTLTMNFSDATSIEAGKPYIVKDNADLVIRTAADWNTFANNVNNGTDTYQGKVVKLAADITVTTMVGTVSGSTQVNAFKGTFDGCGHTLNVNITDKNNQGTAPFRYISGVTIKNLKTTGTVTGNLHCAGLVGFAAHNTTNSIQNCEVAVSVVCNGGNHSHCGGILGHGLSSTTTITDCLFSGSITGTTTATGIIYGWGSGGGTHRIVNCLSAGTYKSCSGIDLLKKNDGTQTITNCYRKTSGGSQGTDASGMSNETLVGNLGSGWEIRDNQVVPKMNHDIVNPVFEKVLISDATANISTDHANFIGSYAPITDAGLLLDTHNPNGDAMHAALSISEPTRDDYTFGGWYTDAGLTTPATTIPFATNGNVTLYGKWTLIDYTITYNLDGGTNHADNPATYNIESATITLQAPTKTGHTFAGWFNNEDCTGDAVTTIAHGSHGNITLYAKWTHAMELANYGDNSSAISEAAASGKYHNVTLADHTIYRDGTWNTLVLPFNLATLTGTPLEGLTVKTLESSTYSDGTLTMNFSDATSIEAGKPYIVKDNADLVIRTAADWNTFANNVNNGTDTYQGKVVKLAANISVTTMVGNSSNPFKGTFDGCGHTLNVSISGGNYTAPFSCVGAASIRNLKVDGSVTTTNGHPCSGLVGFTNGALTITNCVSSVTFTSGYKGNAADGGILGLIDNNSGNVTIEDCAFMGKILTTNGTTDCGGIVGWRRANGVALTIKNCLYAPTALTVGETEPTSSCKTICRYSDPAPTITNCYYTRTLGTAQGTDASSMSNETLVGNLGSGWEIRDNQVVPKMNHDIVNPVFEKVLISDATANISTDHANFIGSYAPITDTDLLLDAHNPNGDAMHAALRLTLSEPIRDGYTFGGWYTDNGFTTPLSTTIPFTADGNVTLYGKWLTEELQLTNNSNNSSAINEAAASDKYYNVTLADRTIYRDGTWNTLVLPFNLTSLTGTPLEGFTVKTLESSTYSDGTLTMNFSDATSIEAGKPYIVKDNADLVIRSAADWNTFAQNVNNGTDTYQGKVVKLAADITVTTMVGGTFNGTLDGCGHNITLSLSSGSTEQIALFNTLGNATIKNLKIAGTITFGKHRPASIASYITGTTTIMNCWSSVAITSNYNPSSADWVDGGAFVARVNSGTTLNMSDCLFTGSMIYGSKNYQGGGMVGWTQSNSTANLTHCLFAPSSMTMTATDSENKTYVFVSGNVRGNLVGCYYNSVANDVNSSVLKKEGTYTTATGSDLLALLGSGWEIRDGQVVPKMADNIVNPVFSNVLISDATANISTDHANFIGSYAPITGDGLLLDAHNPNGDAMHAALRITLSEPTRDGYTFGGWCTDAGQTTPLSTTIPFATNGNVTLYGKWTPITYTVRFNKNHDDASGTMNDQSFTYGTDQALTANAFTAPTGYLFAGWSTTTDGAVEYTDGQSVSNLATEQDAVVNLYAIWGYAYTISYDLAGGNADNPTYYSELSDAITLVNPTRNGYTFTGWTGTDLDEPTMTVTIPAGSTGNRSYTATWSPIAYNITYNLGGGTLPEGESNPTSYNIESGAITLFNPIREDYTFVGWTGTGLNGATMTVTIPAGSTGDREYTATWLQLSTDTYLAYNTTTQEFETLTAPVYTTVTSGTTTMNNGWYVVKENTTISSRITVTGTVNLILFDNATLTASQGLNVTQGVALNIFGQTNGTGVLRATVGDYGYGAAIGGGDEGSGGTITIHGGTITATVGAHGYGAGIGGGLEGNGGTVTIYGGTVTATVGDYGYGAGFGGGYHGNGGTVTINGGTVTATVGNRGYGAAIGGGLYGNGGTVTINGGTVTAKVGDRGNGAAIGGGLEGNGGTVTINGGTVTATSNKGAAIGGGYNGSGGTLTLGDMRVYASAKATTPVASGNRVSTCSSKYTKLESCTDHNGKNGYCTYCDAHVILVNNDAEAAAGEKNTDVISTWNDTETDIILQGRTLYKDGDWNTLCLPFDVTIAESVLDGADVRELASASLIGDELTLNFTKEGEVTTIEAGKPYIIKWKRAEDYVDDDDHNLVNPVFRNVTIKSDMNDFESEDHKVLFKGTYARIDWDKETPSILFVGAQNQLHWPQTGAYLNAFRAYFELTDPETKVRSFNLNFGEEASDIVAIDNSQLTIHNEAGAWYDMQGRKVNGKPTTKGLYIFNGKKVVIK